MWHWRRPSELRVQRFLDTQRDQPWSYPGSSATRDGLSASDALGVPAGYVVDHNRQLLGRGAESFVAAKAAIRDWRMFPAGWTAIEPKDAAIRTEQSIAVLVRAIGVWWLNSARIVYVIDQPRRFGFAYGTLPGHAERGEERFLVEWREDDTVWYDLLAFSRPRYWMARLARPLTRLLQWRFARHSKAAMLTAMTAANPSHR
jgi:uncharacterized protein (UPF0548 family)